MPANRDSLLAGRHQQPLDAKEIRRAVTAFIGLDAKAPVRHEQGARTRFRVEMHDTEEIAEIVFGSDIYPGAGVIDPNSSLSMEGAAAHELTHWRRWMDKTELIEEEFLEIDEALTSLEAAMRYGDKLTPHDIRQLIADAIQRLQLYCQKNRPRAL
jgi:hypothetical protein